MKTKQEKMADIRRHLEKRFPTLSFTYAEVEETYQAFAEALRWGENQIGRKKQ